MAEEMGEKRKRKERERRVTLLIPLSKAKVTKNFSKIKKNFKKPKSAIKKSSQKIFQLFSKKNLSL